MQMRLLLLLLLLNLLSHLFCYNETELYVPHKSIDHLATSECVVDEGTISRVLRKTTP